MFSTQCLILFFISFLYYSLFFLVLLLHLYCIHIFKYFFALRLVFWFLFLRTLIGYKCIRFIVFLIRFWVLFGMCSNIWKFVLQTKRNETANRSLTISNANVFPVEMYSLVYHYRTKLKISGAMRVNWKNSTFIGKRMEWRWWRRKWKPLETWSDCVFSHIDCLMLST